MGNSGTNVWEWKSSAIGERRKWLPKSSANSITRSDRIRVWVIKRRLSSSEIGKSNRDYWRMWRGRNSPSRWLKVCGLDTLLRARSICRLTRSRENSIISTPSCRLMSCIRAAIVRASAQAFSKTRVSSKSTTLRAERKPGWTPDWKRKFRRLPAPILRIWKRWREYFWTFPSSVYKRNLWKWRYLQVWF